MDIPFRVQISEKVGWFEMTSTFSCEWWDRVLSSPGLSHIPEDIFDRVDAQTLAAAELVSKVM